MRFSRDSEQMDGRTERNRHPWQPGYLLRRRTCRGGRNSRRSQTREQPCLDESSIGARPTVAATNQALTMNCSAQKRGKFDNVCVCIHVTERGIEQHQDLCQPSVLLSFLVVSSSSGFFSESGPFFVHRSLFEFWRATSRWIC